MDPKATDQAQGELMLNRLSNFLLILGVTAVIGGLALWSVPLALIAFGMFAIALAFAAAAAKDKKPT